MEKQNTDKQTTNDQEMKKEVDKILEGLLRKYYSIIDETSPEFQEELSNIHAKYEAKFRTLNNLEQMKRHQVFQEALFRQQIFNET